MNNIEKVHIILVYYECNQNPREATRANVKRYPERSIEQYILKINQYLTNTWEFF